jgi:hypothetical protein
MKIGSQFRQGDVLIEEITMLPQGLRKLDHCILAEGEATGHMHIVRDVDAAAMFENGDGTEKFLEVFRNTLVVHEEHGPVFLAPGKYRVKQQREYHPDRIRKVQD